MDPTGPRFHKPPLFIYKGPGGVTRVRGNGCFDATKTEKPIRLTKERHLLVLAPFLLFGTSRCHKYATPFLLLLFSSSLLLPLSKSPPHTNQPQHKKQKKSLSLSPLFLSLSRSSLLPLQANYTWLRPRCKLAAAATICLSRSC